MSCPSNKTWPSTLALGIVSCMRFRHRISVDFPHPEGPMMPLTECSSKSKEMSWMASFGPYQAERGLPRRRRHQPQRFLRRPGHDRDHDRGERDDRGDHAEDEGRREEA